MWTLAQLAWAPRAALAAILRRDRVALALFAYVALGAAQAEVLWPQRDVRTAIEDQLRKAPEVKGMSEAQVDQVVNQAVAVAHGVRWARGLGGPCLILFATAGALWLALGLLLDADGLSFRRVLIVVCHTALFVALVDALVMSALMGAGGAAAPRGLAGLHLGRLLGDGLDAPLLHAWARHLNLATAWWVGLLGAGTAVATDRGLRTTVPVIVAGWLLWAVLLVTLVRT